MLEAVLLNQQSYYLDLIKKINQLKRHQSVYLMTMSLNFSEGHGLELFFTIQQALRKQVKVLILLDANNFIYRPPLKFGPLFYGSSQFSLSLNQCFNQLSDQLQQLISLGARVKLLNLPKHRFSSPFKGRNHIKISIVDHDIYLGGCNLEDHHYIDSMIRFVNDDVYQQLTKFIENVYDQGSVNKIIGHDLRLVFDNFILFIDQGKNNRSLIYEQALQSINQARKRVMMTCQFLPDKEMLSTLSRAIDRGVNVKLYFNDAFVHPIPFNVVHFGRYYYFKYKDIPPNLLARRLSNKKFLHAKILITDDQLLYGSHNFVKVGIKYGTSEIAFQTKDLKIIDQVVDFINVLDNDLSRL